MEKLTRKEYELILELLEQEKNKIHKQAISDAGAREREVDIDFITIKLNTMIKRLDDKLDYMIKKLEG